MIFAVGLLFSSWIEAARFVAESSQFRQHKERLISLIA